MGHKILTFPFVFSVFIACAFWLLRSECISSETIDIECLSAATWSIESFRFFILSILNKITTQAYLTYSVFFGLFGLALVALCAWFLGGISLWSIFYITAVALSAVGELFAFRRQAQSVIYLQLAALVVGALALLVLARRRDGALTKGWIEPGSYGTRPTILEILSVVGIFFVIICTRFYALNRLPAVWDAEGCPHRAVAASWYRIIEQELGYHVQQSSGAAWVTIHHLFNRVNDPLYFYLGERFIGVGISLLNCLVVYLLMRFIRGPFAAVLGLVVYGFGPLDLEWSRLPTLHHLPVAVGLLLTWATFIAFSKRSWPSCAAVALLIVACKYVYPSAKLLAAGPALGVLGVLLWERREWFGHKRKLWLVALGCVLFAGIRTILYSGWFKKFEIVTPVPMIQPPRAKGSLWDSVSELSRQAFGFLYEIFYGPYDPTHWTVHATIEPYRALPSICVVFSTLALLRLLFLIRKPYALICIGLIIGGLIPGIVTGLAERRIAYSLVFLTLLAVIEVAWFIDVALVGRAARLNSWVKVTIVILVGSAMFALQTQGYFSRVHGKNIQQMVTERVRPLVAPNMLVVYLAEEHRCEFFYGIYDKLVQSGGNIAFATANDTPKGATEMIQDPTPVLNSWYYALTDLEPQVQSLKSHNGWSRILYVFQDTNERASWKTLLKERYPSGAGFTEEFSGMWKQRIFFFDTAPVGS